MIGLMVVISTGHKVQGAGLEKTGGGSSNFKHLKGVGHSKMCLIYIGFKR